jgi:hypothetical protein
MPESDFIGAQVTAKRPDRQKRLRDSAIIGAVLLGLGAFFVIGMAIERLPISIGFIAAIIVLGVLYSRTTGAPPSRSLSCYSPPTRSCSATILI